MAAQYPPCVAASSLHTGHIKGSVAVPGQNCRPEALPGGAVQLNCVSAVYGFCTNKHPFVFLSVFLVCADETGKDSGSETVSVDCV